MPGSTEPELTISEWADHMIRLFGSDSLPHPQWFSRANSVFLPSRMESWRRRYGEEEVNISMARLKSHVAKCWQPCWYELAGVLMPPGLEGIPHSDPTETHVDEPPGTTEDGGRDSNAAYSVARTKVHTRGLRSNRTADTHSSPSPSRGEPRQSGTEPEKVPHKRPVPDSNVRRTSRAKVPKNAASSLHPPTSALTADDGDGIQSTRTPQPRRPDGSSSTVDSVGSSRPRRKAGEQAVSRMRECQAKGKKRSGPSRGNPSSAAQRKKPPAKVVQQANADGQGTTVVEHPPLVPDEVIPQITAPSQSPRCAPRHTTSEESRSQLSKNLDALPPSEARLSVSLQQQEDLMKVFTIKERYIATLRKALDDWQAVTEDDRELLGRFNTKADILGTLTYEEESLRRLKYRVNSVDNQIRALRGEIDSTQEVTCIAEGSQDAEPVRRDREIDTDDEVDIDLG